MPNFDYQLFKHLNGLAGKNHAFDRAVIFFARDFIWLLIPAVGAYYWLQEGNTRAIVAIAASVVLARIMLAEGIRLFYYRKRPYLANTVVQLVRKGQEASFPSGHAVAVVAIGMAIGYFDLGMGLVIIFCGIIIGLARIIAGLHYPLDVVGGIVGGLLAGLITHITLK